MILTTEEIGYAIGGAFVGVVMRRYENPVKALGVFCGGCGVSLLLAPLIIEWAGFATRRAYALGTFAGLGMLGWGLGTKMVRYSDENGFTELYRRVAGADPQKEKDGKEDEN
jgi:hypothetical protein